MKKPEEKHIKSAIIGMHKSGASPEEIAMTLEMDIIWNLPYNSIFIQPIDYVKKVIKNIKP